MAGPPPELLRNKSTPNWMDPAGHDTVPVIEAEHLEVDRPFTKRFLRRDVARPDLGPMDFSVYGERWSLDSFLSAGAYGEVYLATHLRAGRRYVIKFLHNPHDPEINLIREFSVEMCSHPNVVAYVGLVTGIYSPKEWGRARHMVFMEAIPNGELFDIVMACSEKNHILTEGTARRFARDVVNGMAELSRFGVTHRDLKPDNLLLGARGQVVIIDLGSAAKVEAAEHAAAAAAEECEKTPGTGGYLAVGAPPTPSTPSTPFMRAHTTARGTLGYRAPEVVKNTLVRASEYDSERADVFTAGVVIFTMQFAFPPFDDGTGTPGGQEANHKLLEELGASAAQWNQWVKWRSNVDCSDELKDFINCLWRLDPERRPDFRILEAVMEQDPQALKEWPELKWLAGPVSTPMDFVQELFKLKPAVCVECPGVCEALALWVRSFGSPKSDQSGNDERAEAAFKSANSSSSGQLTADELRLALEKQDSTISDVDVAVLMRTRMSEGSSGMTLEQFQQLARDWSFGGRPIVHIGGRNRARTFAWNLRPSADAMDKELGGFADEVMDALKSRGCQCVLHDEEEECLDPATPATSTTAATPLTSPLSSLSSQGSKELDVEESTRKANTMDLEEIGCSRAICLTATASGRRTLSSPGGATVCQLRIRVFSLEGKLILESKRRWGSAIEELQMLRTANDHLCKLWGARAEVPQQLAADS